MFCVDDPEVFMADQMRNMNEGKGSPVMSRRDDGSFAGSPKSNARSFGSFDHINQDNSF